MGRNPQPRHDRRGTPLRDWRAEGLSRAAGEGSGDPPTWAHVGWSSARATSTSGATRFFGTGCRFERLLQLLAATRVRDGGEHDPRGPCSRLFFPPAVGAAWPAEPSL